MPERRVPTLADVQRQVWMRGIIGWLLGGLSLIFLLLFLVKHVYVNSYSLFAAEWGGKLRKFIDSLLEDWAVLDLLWRAIPPWQLRPTLPTTANWEYVYTIWGAVVVAAIGGLLLRSASARCAQIAEFRQEMQREAWRQQAREARGLAPNDRGPTTVIQDIGHQYLAPPEPWSQTIRGILILGLIVTVSGGLIVAVIQLCAEYGYFQPYWPSSRN